MVVSLPTRPNHNFQDLTGRTFGKMVVVGYAGRTKRGNSIWYCQCECGDSHNYKSSDLTSGKRVSCGCEARAAAARQHTSSQVVDPSGTIVLKDGHVCLVDPEDVPLVAQFNWTPTVKKSGAVYVARSVPTHMFIHVLIMGRTGVDHKNGNALDNRRENLRFASQSQNQANKGKLSTSRNRYKGVRFRRKRGIWEARITCQGEKYYLGSYKTEEEAAKAYDRGAKEHFGEFARLNFPDQ